MNSRTGDMLERRTVKWLRDIGYHAERVSRRGRFGGGDLFGCIDIVALNEEGIMLAQVTTKSGRYARRRKIREARLPYPVRLFSWEKAGRIWGMVSEVIEPAEGGE